MKTQIYLVRHCESEGNFCRRCHAQFDGIVTRKGLNQAQSLVNRFKEIDINAIYSSDSFRARVTAEPLAKAKGLRVKYQHLLREYTIGTWEGLSIGQTAKDNPELWETWCTTPYAHKIPGADNFKTVAERGLFAIKQMIKENRGKTVVAVTHSCLLTCTLTVLLNKNISYYSRIKTGDNTAVTLVVCDEDDNIVVEYINDDSHLPDELKRSNYTGKRLDDNMFFNYCSFPEQADTFLNLARQWKNEMNKNFNSVELLHEGTKSFSQNSKYIILPQLIDRSCGLLLLKEDQRFPKDYGLLEIFYVNNEISSKGFEGQAIGEAIDILRRNGKRYLVLQDNGISYVKTILSRLCFDKIKTLPDYYRLLITVPGIEGPIY